VAISTSLLSVFGKIIDIVIVSVTDCYFVCELLITDSFSSHHHAYEVRQQRHHSRRLFCVAIIYVTSKLSSHDTSLIEKELAIQLCVRGYHLYNDNG